MKLCRALCTLSVFSLSLFTVAALAAPDTGVSIGLVAAAQNATLGGNALSEGATVYSGDELSTGDGGSLLVRFGQLSLQLQSSSTVHVYQAPYGVVVELSRGAANYTTPGISKNLVIVANDVRVTPNIAVPGVGSVSVEDPCDVTVYVQRGQSEVRSGSESHYLEEGKSFRVRAENQLTYRQYISPDAGDYHKYHEHKPCVADYQPMKGHAPIAGGQSKFIYVVGGAAAGLAGFGAYKALESPSRP